MLTLHSDSGQNMVKHCRKLLSEQFSTKTALKALYNVSHLSIHTHNKKLQVQCLAQGHFGI